ncbi:response regulator [Microcoleus sp. FACHB-1515]|uniref:response regulator n=1 Tax=Cyanophyceae TaxID=3028117 RepID=UPI00168736AB|nr:response regulator [Microcoleus sp. FACHB-1515]MBD2088532.1 response regulator [Microcoleus sp. FACHB-1515]
MLSRLKIGTKIALSFALGLGIFAVIAALAYRNTKQLVSRSAQQSHTYEVLAELQDLETQIVTAESNSRAFIITRDDSFLPPHEAALRELRQNINDLRRLTVDNSVQQQNLDRLQLLIDERIEVFEENIVLTRQGGVAAINARPAARRQQIRDLAENIRTVIGEMEAEEQRLLAERSGQTDVAAQQTIDSIRLGFPIYCLLIGMIGYALSRNISRPLHRISEVADRVGEGDLTTRIPVYEDRRDEIGSLVKTFNDMIDRLQQTTDRSEAQNWLKSNLAELSRILQGRRDRLAISQRILSEIVPLVNAQHGVFYIMDAEADPPVLRMLASYAYQERRQLSNEFHLGESLVGQCAIEKQRILLTDVPGDYIRVSSGLGAAPPLNIVVLPVLFEKEVVAVLELASLKRFTPIQLEFLDQVTESIGVVLNTIAFDVRNAQLLEQAQHLAVELQHQQEELVESNRRLEEQAGALQASEALLKEQQEELQQTNEELQQLNTELEEKAELLSNQKQEVERKNVEIELARVALADKAEQLALSSKYKSEFLANMSHELRTPLNSLLILAKLLSENGEGNLSDKQMEYSRTIYSAGTDLLELINDILDLAKIESGMMTLNVEPMPFVELKGHLDRTFEQVAQNKNLSFTVSIDPNLPSTLQTDAKRLQQILKNLLSNAFKFTDKGGVTLKIFATQHPLNGLMSDAIAFAVTDTGIGIPAEKQKIIFEAFQQADGTTSRKYGGTGLGLSISRELAQLLGGAIEIASQPGQGSTFTLYLPLNTPALPPAVAAAQPAPEVPLIATPREKPPAPPEPEPIIAQAFPEVPDDRDSVRVGDRTLLIVEDDVNFARILLGMARQNGFKGIVTLRGNPALALTRQFKPDAIMLDLRLPDMDGWAVLDRLKHDPQTRHIPVHILSVDEAQQRGLQQGAIAFLQKPVSPEALTQALNDIKGFVDRQVRQLLIIEDDSIQAQSIVELIGNGDVESTAVGSGVEALAMLEARQFDCVVLDLGLPDMSGFDLMEQIKRVVERQGAPPLPIIVYTGKELSRQEETELKRLAETIIVKDVQSPERLLDETALFLHRVQANLPKPKRQILEQLHQNDPVLAGKKVLIVDDDVRNIFALTSLLERYQMQVLYAENGRDGIAALQNHPDVNVVLMDVMMPEMDGYETTRAIREQDSFRSLPIIALTAKAMQGDREKCLEAGASDYITKPVDTEQLLSLLRVWLYGRA